MQQVSWVTMNFVPFSEKSLDLVLELYRHAARHVAVIRSHVLQSVISTLRFPLSRKYDCPSQSTWKLAVNSLLTVLELGLPIARQPGKTWLPFRKQEKLIEIRGACLNIRSALWFMVICSFYSSCRSAFVYT